MTLSVFQQFMDLIVPGNDDGGREKYRKSHFIGLNPNLAAGTKIIRRSRTADLFLGHWWTYMRQPHLPLRLEGQKELF